MLMGISAASLFLTCGFFALVTATSVTQAQEPSPPLLSSADMTFSLADSGLPKGLEPAVIERMKQRTEWLWISAEGVIKPDTPQKFRDFLRREVCGSRNPCDLQAIGIKTIALHSSGGNLAAGMKLGEMIRALNLRTAIASTHAGSRGNRSAPGKCFSACGYAFLGGVHRRYSFSYVPDRELWKSSGAIGVHRFKNGSAMAKSIQEIELAPIPDLPTECRNRDTVELIQCVDVILIDYIRKMGVDVGFFRATASASNDSIELLDLVTLRKLNVLTDSIHINWKSEPWANTYAAVSIAPDPVAAVRVLRALCDRGKPRLLVDVGPAAGPNFTGEETSNGIIAESWVFSINKIHFVVDRKNVEAFVDTMRFTFDMQEWKDGIAGSSISIEAFPLRQVDRPISERNSIRALIDNASAVLFREATTHCS